MLGFIFRVGLIFGKTGYVSPSPIFLLRAQWLPFLSRALLSMDLPPVSRATISLHETIVALRLNQCAGAEIHFLSKNMAQNIFIFPQAQLLFPWLCCSYCWLLPRSIAISLHISVCTCNSHVAEHS